MQKRAGKWNTCISLCFASIIYINPIRMKCQYNTYKIIRYDNIVILLICTLSYL